MLENCEGECGMLHLAMIRIKGLMPPQSLPLKLTALNSVVELLSILSTHCKPSIPYLREYMELPSINTVVV